LPVLFDTAQFFIKIPIDFQKYSEQEMKKNGQKDDFKEQGSPGHRGK
jgi:hypothetical protein